MKGYAEHTMFNDHTLRVHELATRLVEFLPADPESEIRCHELARAIGKMLKLSVVDGKYGAVEHSWLEGFSTRCLLDVYTPGRTPMVQLIDMTWAAPNYYKRGALRDDIDDDVITKLIDHWATDSRTVDLVRAVNTCRASKDGEECHSDECPQERDGEPMKTGRHCPLDLGGLRWDYE